MSIFLLLSSCASILPLFEEAKTQALVDPGQAGARFQADARVDLSTALLDELLAQLVVGTSVADTPMDVGVGVMVPHLEIRKFEILPAVPEGGGIAAEIRVAGPITLKTPLGNAEQHIGAQGRLVASLAVERRGADYALVLHPTRLDRLEINADGVMSQALSSSLQDLIVAAVPPLDLTTFPADEIPLRGMDVVRTETGVSLLLRTAAPDGSPLPSSLPEPPDDGFRVAISAGSLQQLARRQAFLADPLQHDVVPEPTSLLLAPNGDFELGLRLWRPVGRGWWRTCSVKGGFDVKNGRLKIRTDTVDELDQSPGADFVDPMMALAEGIVFRTMEKAMDLNLPAMRTDKVGGGTKAATYVERVDVVEQSLVAVGDLELSGGKKKKGGPR